MDFPKRGAPGVSGNRTAILAGGVAGIEQKLACDAHRQFLFGDGIDVLFGPSSRTVMRNHFGNYAGALIRLGSRVNDRDVDVVVRVDVIDVLAAINAFPALLPRDEDEPLKAYQDRMP
jgi:hypothetical protein